jgi:transposase
LIPEFNARTVEPVRASGKSVAEVCRELDLTETAVRRWLAQADIDAGRRGGEPGQCQPSADALGGEGKMVRCQVRIEVASVGCSTRCPSCTTACGRRTLTSCSLTSSPSPA